MNILVANDDGIDSPGLWALAEAMARVGNTLIVAPARQQSGVGTSISLFGGMSITDVPARIPGVQAYAVGGTPSDCVILGLCHFAREQDIDLVISGINIGANLGQDIPYSGTVMATLQGHFRKIPSIAVSLAVVDFNDAPNFDVVARVAEYLALHVRDGHISTDFIINTNVPNIPLGEIKGIATTRAASSAYLGSVEILGSERLSYAVRNQLPGAENFTCETLDGMEQVIDKGTDIWAINAGMISITPLRFEVTDHDSLLTLEEHVTMLETDILGNGHRK